MRSPRRVITIAALVVVALTASVAGALAASSSSPTPYSRYGISANNVPVTGLPGAKGFPRASVIVPKAWKVVSRGTASIKFRTDKAACPYLVTFKVVLKTGPAGTAADHVTTALPAAAPPYVQDYGVRRSYAWRVVRQKSAQRLDGMQAVATTNAWKGLPAGQSVWNELVASAPRANSGAESCHSGFYREVSRQIGDALATNTRVS